MFKKICSALICAAVIGFMTMSVFAANIVNITRPEGSEESTFSKSYVLCGNTSLENVVVELSVYDSSLGMFVPYANTDGQTYWTIGSSGMFAKEVTLPNTGANKIQIAAYAAGNPFEKQYQSFTINLLNPGLKEMIMNSYLKFTDVFSNAWNIFE